MKYASREAPNGPARAMLKWLNQYPVKVGHVRPIHQAFLAWRVGGQVREVLRFDKNAAVTH
ncbi:MAG: hypothetical protein AAF227_03245 [Pseudomonadota bacterium]